MIMWQIKISAESSLQDDHQLCRDTVEIISKLVHILVAGTADQKTKSYANS